MGLMGEVLKPTDELTIPPKTGPSILAICSWYPTIQAGIDAQEPIHGRADYPNPESI